MDKAEVLKLLTRLERGVCYCVEQPAQSWAFKCPWMVSAAQQASMLLGCR